MKALVFFLSSVFVCSPAAAQSGSPASETAESRTARPFEAVTSESGESWIGFSRDGDRMVFGRHSDGWSNHVLWESTRTGEEWSEPRVLPFSGTFNDRGARFHPDRNVLFFSSDRPLDAADDTRDFNLWTAHLYEGTWSAPEPLSELNTPANDFHPSVTSEGVVWFSSDREESLGRSDLFRAVPGNDGYRIEHTGAPLSTARSEADSFIDSAERFIVFARTDDPEGLGGDDLFLSVRTEDSWSDPVHLGPSVNSSEYEYGPYVSADGVTLFFTSHDGGTADILRVPVVDLPGWPTN